MKRTFAIILTLAMVFALFTACAKTETPAASGTAAPSTSTAPAATAPAEAESKEPVYLAWAGPMTGDMQQYGETAMAAIKIALEDINGNGGVLGGRELVVEYFDDKNDATEAINVANRIIDADKYTAVIGHFGSTTCMAVANVYQEAGMIMYSATCSHADMTSTGEYIFRNLLTQAVEARAYADFLYNDCGYKKVACIYVNDDWGKNVYDNFAKRYTELGGEIVVTENFISGQTKDFSPMISKAKEAAPEAFFSIAMYADTAQILIQADALEFDVQQVVSTAVFKQELIDVAGELANGVILLNIFPTECELPDFARVMDRYQEMTGKMGDFHVMCNYDVTTQIANAINVAGSDETDAVRDALATAPFDALSGPYSMSEIGDAERSTAPATIIDGKFARYDIG